MKQLSLFSDDTQARTIKETDHYIYYPEFLNPKEANVIFSRLLDLEWQQNKMSIKHEKINIPRLESLYGNQFCEYQYSGIKMIAKPWNETLFSLKIKIQDRCNYSFDMVFCNFYRDGNDSIGWHSDDDEIMGIEPAIASISLGATRQFKFMDKKSKNTENLWLEHGSLLLMKRGCQTSHFHCVPKTTKSVGTRINLTFRPFCP